MDFLLRKFELLAVKSIFKGWSSRGITSRANVENSSSENFKGLSGFQF